MEAYPAETIDRTPVLQLIKDNIDDQDARHLMIISSGEAAVGIVEQQLREYNPYALCFGI